MNETSFYILLLSLLIISTLIGYITNKFLLNRPPNFLVKKANKSAIRWNSQSKPIFGGVTFFGLFIIGSALERLIGSFRYALVYFIAGIGSSFTILLLYIFSGEPVLTVGASGAIYGVLGTFLYLTINHPEKFDPRDVQGIKGLIIINVVFTFLAPNISVGGHIGGLVTGYLIAMFLFKDEAKRKAKWQNKSYYRDPFTDVRKLEDIKSADDDDDDPFARYD